MKTTKRLYGANTVLYTSVTVMCPVPFPRLCFLLQCSVKLAACFGFGLVILQSSHGWNFFLLSHTVKYTTKSATFSQDGNGVLGAGHKFSESLSDNYYYAKSGTGYFKVKSDVHAKKDFYYYIAYGHSQLIASINFSVGIGGGDASISFTTGTVIADDTKGSKVTS